MSNRNCVTPPRHLPQDGLCDKPRMDIYPIHQERIGLGKVGGINWRRITAENASKQGSAAWGPGQAYARRPSVEESPEKWLMTNALWSNQALVQEDHNETVSWTALRLLIDALGYKCGHRTVEWSSNDHKDWNKRQKQNGGTRNQCIQKNEDFKTQTSLQPAEISSLLSTSDRIKMNQHAHSMRVPALAVALKWIINKYPKGATSIGKVFNYVVGCTVETATTNSALADQCLSIEGVDAIPDDLFGIDPAETEERGTW